MDQWGFEQLNAWLAHRVALPVGPLFCVIDGPTRGRAWAATAARAELVTSRPMLVSGGGLRRISFAMRMPSSSRARASQHHSAPARSHGPGHDLDLPAGIDPSEIIDAVRSRRQPTISATAGLTL